VSGTKGCISVKEKLGSRGGPGGSGSKEKTEGDFKNDKSKWRTASNCGQKGRGVGGKNIGVLIFFQGVSKQEGQMQEKKRKKLRFNPRTGVPKSVTLQNKLSGNTARRGEGGGFTTPRKGDPLRCVEGKTFGGGRRVEGKFNGAKPRLRGGGGTPLITEGSGLGGKKKMIF